jgi:hypothetical protein
MLEPDKVYTLESRESATAPWILLAGIDVTKDNESWNLNTQVVAALGTAAQIRLALASSLPAVANLLRENTPTVVSWNEYRSGVEYPAVGATFAGAYTYATSSGTATGTLAMNIQIQPLSTGGAMISTILWYTPGASGTPTPVALEASGGSVVLSRLDTRLTPAYTDPCYGATSKFT